MAARDKEKGKERAFGARMELSLRGAFSSPSLLPGDQRVGEVPAQGGAEAFPGQGALGKAGWEGVPARLGRRGVHSTQLHTDPRACSWLYWVPPWGRRWVCVRFAHTRAGPLGRGTAGRRTWNGRGSLLSRPALSLHRGWAGQEPHVLSWLCH